MDRPDSNTGTERIDRLLGRRYTQEEVNLQLSSIHDTILSKSPRLNKANFEQISTADLMHLFELYDQRCFASDLGHLLRSSGAPLSFQLSPRLTRSAGLTKRYSPRGWKGPGLAPATRYEIVLSTTLLFQSFRDVERTVRVNGVVCKDRLEAAQRVFEHELLHLLEMLVWARSSCSADPYKMLAWNYFAHSDTRHDLVTQRERASTKFDIRVGDVVTFDFEGQQYTGKVNRITRRATVLVEHARGEPYQDGKRYLKFYLPLPMLQKMD